MIYTLLICVSLLLIWAYSVYDRELFSPPVIVCMSLAFSILCACYNTGLWHAVYMPYTVFVIVSGLMVFCLTSFWVRSHFAKQMPTFILESERKEIVISRQKKWIGIAIAVVSAYFIVSAVSSNVDMRGVSDMDDYAAAMQEYRHESSYTEGGGLPFIPRQCQKIIEVLQYIFLYIFSYNLAISKKFYRNAIYLIPTLLYCYTAVRGGSRTVIIHCICAFISFYYIINLKISNRAKTHNIRILTLSIIGVSIFMYVFASLRQYVGRINDDTVIDYITAYGGGSIECFNVWLNSPHTLPKEFGEKTFYGLYKNLSSMGLVEDPGIVHSEFIWARSGVSVGNVYTAFWRPMRDFGLIGMYVFQVLEAWILTWLYEKAKRSIRFFSMYVIIFGLLSYTLFEYCIEEYLFMGNLSFTFLTKVLLVWVCGVFFLNSKKRNFLKSTSSWGY